jgi:hypothetical protein
MQTDCSAANSTYDCGQGIRAILMYDGARGAYDTVPRMFANCDCEDSSYPYLGGTYNPQIFAEDYPNDDDPGWTMYLNETYNFNSTRFNNTEPSVSYVWNGVVTTVDNPGWGVTAGTKVQLLLFFAAYPSADFIIWPGFKADWAFSEIYGQIAQTQYDSVKALLQDWEASRTTDLPTSANPFPSTELSSSPSEAPATEFVGGSGSMAQSSVVSMGIVAFGLVLLCVS